MFCARSHLLAPGAHHGLLCALMTTIVRSRDAQSKTREWACLKHEMAKWRNGVMTKWLNSELANYYSKFRKKTGAIFRLTGVEVCRSTVCIYRPLLIKCSLKIPSNLLA